MIMELYFLNYQTNYFTIYYMTNFKVHKTKQTSAALQVLQNDMIRVIFGLRRQDHVNLQQLREKVKLMSVNQLCIYHTLLEAYNIMRYSASEQIQTKWTDSHDSLKSMFNP